MTTFAELKTALARDLRDPSNKTFSDADLGDLINHGIAEVSRVAPQKFIEDLPYYTGQLTYQLHGGQSNSLVNGGFEDGDTDTVLDAYTSLDSTDGGASTGGWLVKAGQTLQIRHYRGSNAKDGRRYAIVRVPAATVNGEYYQDVVVNPDTVYTLNGWHWFGGSISLLAGLTGCRLAVDTLDSVGAVVTPNVIVWDTTSSRPVYRSGSYTIPSSGVSYLRVKLIALGTPSLSVGTVAADALQLIEADQSNLVSRLNSTNVEVRRVEIVDQDLDPPRRVYTIPPGSTAPESTSDAGWDVWDGKLSIPYRHANSMTEGQHILRVWGYAPYDKLTTSSQVTDLTDELEFAVRQYAHMAGLHRLVMDRDLFTQWQTAANNTDASPASIMNAYAVLADQWRRTKRELAILREG